jgi:hypothetical protein
MTATPHRVAFRAAAQDEGCDVVANFWWSDMRPGHWGLVGQVTVIKDSDQWALKLSEVKADYWSRCLGAVNSNAVTPFLAVPYHVEPQHLQYLVDKGCGIVIDRLRLTQRRAEILADEEELLKGIGVV